MAALSTPHNRDIKTFLRDYGAKDITIVGGGKHERFRFKFRDQTHEYLTNSHGDSRGIEKDKSRLVQMLGPKIETEARPRTSLEQLTDNARSTSTAQLARNTLSTIRETVQPRSEPVLSSHPSIPVETAHDVGFRTDDNSFDLIFRARCKNVLSSGAIESTDRVVAALNLSLPVVLLLFDTIEPVVTQHRDAEIAAREAEAEAEALVEAQARAAEAEARAEAAAANNKQKPRKMTPIEVIPLGMEAILRVIEDMIEGRRIAARETGLTIGGAYNTRLHEWYKDHGLADLPSHIRNDLSKLSQQIDEVRAWYETEPKSLFAGKKPAWVLNRFLNRPKPAATPSVVRPSEIRRREIEQVAAE